MDEKIKRQKTIKKLVEEGKTFRETALFFNLTKQRIHQIFYTNYSHQIEKDTLRRKFPNLRRLTGRGYTRELVRIRDGHQCKKCGKSWKKGEKKFEVHHLEIKKGNSKKYDRILDIGKLITLCRVCHLKIHVDTRRILFTSSRHESELTTPALPPAFLMDSRNAT